MKLRKFKVSKVVRLSQGNWMYHVSFLDYEGVTVSLSKEGFISKTEAQAQAFVKRMEMNSFIPTMGR